MNVPTAESVLAAYLLSLTKSSREILAEVLMNSIVAPSVKLPIIEQQIARILNEGREQPCQP